MVQARKNPKSTMDRARRVVYWRFHYKHRHDRQPLSKSIQDEIDQIDIEQLIADAYDDAVTIYNDLEVLDILEQKHVLGLNLLSAYIFEHLNKNSQMYNFSSQVDTIDSEEFELAADDDEDINSDSCNDDDCSSDDDHTDDEEQEITTEFINTTKKKLYWNKSL
ncbi:unnamed protein product [Rotaria sp. Silwood2]|nr:unnamed protein product [Rotaria sp. Silwood2]CAF2946174.1 unnamed protein product [Rotaria sp. Silwood2]